MRNNTDIVSTVTKLSFCWGNSDSPKGFPIAKTIELPQEGKSQSASFMLNQLSFLEGEILYNSTEKTEP